MEAFIRLLIGLVSLGLTSVHCMVNEPRCYSRFDWEDQLLEKAIRTEVKVEQYMEKINTALAEIQGQKDAFREWKQSAETIAKKLQLTVEEKLDGFENNLTALQEHNSTPVVAFNVRDAKDLSPQKNEVIQFRTVILNIGQAYVEATGIFIAPVSGIYIFSIQVATSSGKHGIFQLAVNDSSNVILQIAKYNSASSYSSTSGTVAHKLTKGQQVWVQFQYNSGSTQRLNQHPDYSTNQFSGMLVHKTLD